MKRTISARDFDERYLRELEGKYQRYAFDDDGSIYPKHVYHWLINPLEAMRLSLDFAMGYKISGEEKYRERTARLLDYLKNHLVHDNGYIYWPITYPINMCQHGRWCREAMRAAQLTGNREALEWMCEMFNAWPYDHENHRFLERFMPVSHLPTSINGTLTCYNMMLDGMVDCWILAKETGCTDLLEKARDTLCNYILPGQREDGLWSYHSVRDVDMGLLNDGEDEYNYCLYVVYLLSHLLEDPESRALVQEPICRAIDEFYRRFSFGDGSMYAPVHWGWEHVWESTIFSAVISWRLFHFCGLAEYEEPCARAMYWLLQADIGIGRPNNAYAGVGLYWGSYFFDMYEEDFCVTGEVAPIEDIIRTMEYVHDQLAVLRSDCTHQNAYFQMCHHKTLYVMERKIARMKRGTTQQKANIARAPEKTVLELPWQYENTCYAGTAELSYDDEALYLRVQTDCKQYKQVYEGVALFAGDGLLLEFAKQSKTEDGGMVMEGPGQWVKLNAKGCELCRMSLACENGKPVIYRYNNKLPFRGDVRMYVHSEPRGWYLENSTLSMTMTSEGMLYEAKILWSELGVKPEQGDVFDAGLAIAKEAAYGPQYNQWGRTGIEDLNDEYSGEWMF